MRSFSSLRIANTIKYDCFVAEYPTLIQSFHDIFIVCNKRCDLKHTFTVPQHFLIAAPTRILQTVLLKQFLIILMYCLTSARSDLINGPSISSATSNKLWFYQCLKLRYMLESVYVKREKNQKLSLLNRYFVNNLLLVKTII